MKPDMKEVVETLVELAGTADRAAEWLNVSAAAVSEWRSDGGYSNQSMAAAEMAVCRFTNRHTFIYGWLLERTTPLAINDFKLVVEVVGGNATGRAGGDERSTRSFTKFRKSERDEVVRTLTRSYMNHDLLADGDVLVFFRPGETVFAYVDLPDVSVGFTRREWEPWWPLRQFVGGRSG